MADPVAISLWGFLCVATVCTVVLVVMYSWTIKRALEGSRYTFVFLMAILGLLS
jgi:hypothetical protein